MSMRERTTRDERILLVEDEEPIRDLVTTALRFTGFTVETAATGPEGLTLARNDAWHVLVLDVDAHRVWRADREIELSPTEYRLLRYLMHNAGRVLSRPQIIEHVWDYGHAIEPSGVETYISYLRRKLDDRDARLIRTVRGVGYALREPEPVPVGE